MLVFNELQRLQSRTSIKCWLRASWGQAQGHGHQSGIGKKEPYKKGDRSKRLIAEHVEAIVLFVRHFTWH